MPTRDASSPARVLNTTVGNVHTWTTAAFSPPAGSVLYWHVNSDPGVAGLTPTFNPPTSTGTALTWAIKGQINNASGGACVVWWAFNANAQAGITSAASVTWSAAPAAAGSCGAWLEVVVGADPSQASAAVATSTSTTQTNNPAVTTTRAGSRVAGLMQDWNATGAPTSSDTIDSYTVAGRTSGGRAFKAADSGAPGSVSINFVSGGAAPINTFVVYEILASTSSPPLRPLAFTNGQSSAILVGLVGLAGLAQVFHKPPAPATAHRPRTFISTTVQTPEIAQPQITRRFFQPAVVPVQPKGFFAGMAQAAPNSLQPSFSKAVFSPVASIPTRFLGALPQTGESSQPNLQRFYFPEYPALRPLSIGLPQALDQPQPAFSHGQFTPPSILSGKFIGNLAQTLDQPSPLFQKFAHLEQPQIRAFGALGQIVEPVQSVFFKLSDAARLPAGASTAIPLQWPEVLQPWFKGTVPPSAVAVQAIPSGASYSVQPRFEIIQPQFQRVQPPSVQPAVQTPVGASWAVQPRPLQQPSPVFYKLSSPAGTLPAADLHANWQQVVQSLQPTFQRGQLASTPPPAPSPEIPTPASLAQAARNLFQPPAQFFKTNTYPAAAPAAQTPVAASLAQQTRHLDQPQPYFKGFSPKPSFLPPNLFGSIPAQSPEQQSPVFSRQPPPSVALTPPPRRPHIFGAQPQVGFQPGAVFFHQPPPSTAVVPPKPGDGCPDPVRKKHKKHIEDSRLDHRKHVRQELRELWDEEPPPPPPIQLPLFEIPDLTPGPDPDDDIIPALLLLGLL